MIGCQKETPTVWMHAMSPNFYTYAQDYD